MDDPLFLKREEIHVGMADFKIARPPQILVSLGLGSCVGVVLFDVYAKIAGMAHIMLPDIELVRHKTNRAKFANTAIPDMLEQLLAAGAERRLIKAKIAGGAHMFGALRAEAIFNIGSRNAQKVKETLQQLHIRLLAEDTGGSYGRSIYMNPENGELIVRAISCGEKTL